MAPRARGGARLAQRALAKGAGLARARLERALVAERKGEETNDWLAKAMRRLSDETRDGVHQRTLARSLSAASLPEKRAQRRSKIAQLRTYAEFVDRERPAARRAELGFV